MSSVIEAVLFPSEQNMPLTAAAVSCVLLCLRTPSSSRLSHFNTQDTSYRDEEVRNPAPMSESLLST